jgi:hypothetical protein
VFIKILIRPRKIVNELGITLAEISETIFEAEIGYNTFLNDFEDGRAYFCGHELTNLTLIHSVKLAKRNGICVNDSISILLEVKSDQLSSRFTIDGLVQSIREEDL